jgi:hypothetical protein
VREVLVPVDADSHPVSLLVNDLLDLGLPDGSVYVKELSEYMGQVELAKGRVFDSLDLRVRVYAIPLSFAGLERFFATRWSGFRFLDVSDSEDPDLETGDFTQYLVYRSDGLQPVAERQEIPEQVPEAGLALLTSNAGKLPAELWDELGLPSRRKSSILVVLNFRSFEDPDDPMTDRSRR